MDLSKVDGKQLYAGVIVALLIFCVCIAWFVSFINNLENTRLEKIRGECPELVERFEANNPSFYNASHLNNLGTLIDGGVVPSANPGSIPNGVD